MITFLIIAFVVFQLISYGVIFLLFDRYSKNIKGIVETLADTYLQKIDKDMEAAKPSNFEEPDPNDIAELTPEEEIAFRLKPNNETGDTEE